ncbi:NlpC/P60 family N-terminal domain-containing protein [soil metagenome]
MYKKLRPLNFISLLLFTSFSTATTLPEAPPNFLPTVKQSSQNALDYLPYFGVNQRLLSQRQQLAFSYNYLQHYYSPWRTDRAIVSVQQQAQASLKHFFKYPGWGADHRPYSQQWIQDIINNAQLFGIVNHVENAIIVNSTTLRVMPTSQPSYTNWTKAGEGYPFDNVQQSLLSINTPIKVLHISRDRIWSLVIAPEANGWVKNKDLAFIDISTQMTLMQANFYVTPIKDRGKWHIGSIYPVSKGATGQLEVLMATAQSPSNRAILQPILPPKGIAVVWPIAATPTIMAQLANQLMGEPYGWGGLEGHRDCSATTRDLMAALGIWLPRNSKAQLKQGTVYSLSGMKKRQKQSFLRRKARPWLTLVGHPGHVMLYVGGRQGNTYVFHNKWGMETRDIFGREGRSVIGHAAITPTNLGEGFSNIPRSLLDTTTVMAVLQ